MAVIGVVLLAMPHASLVAHVPQTNWSNMDSRLSLRAQQTIIANEWWCAQPEPGRNASLACRRHTLRRLYAGGALSSYVVPSDGGPNRKYYAINAQGRIFGYTIGNDMSSRDIEGENPLYLPQAKVYDRSAALGPALLVTDEALPLTTEISIVIQRDGADVFAGCTTLSQIKRTFVSLAEFLFRDNAFPRGCYLMTGTGVVPPDNFTLLSGDEVRITIAPIGTLVNSIA